MTARTPLVGCVGRARERGREDAAARALSFCGGCEESRFAVCAFSLRNCSWNLDPQQTVVFLHRRPQEKARAPHIRLVRDGGGPARALRCRFWRDAGWRIGNSRWRDRRGGGNLPRLTRRVFSARASQRGSSAGTREVSRHGADGGGAGASRDARRRERARAFPVDSTSVKTRSRWRFPPGRARPPRWSRGDRVASTSRIPPRDSRRARYAVHISRGPVSSPEPATTRGALKTESSAPPIAHLAHPRSQDAAPKPARTREALQNQLYLKPKPPGAAARGPTALGKTARTSLKVRARPPPARAPFVIFSKRINPFWCHSDRLP